MTTAPPKIAAYGLTAPTVDDAYAAVVRVHGSSATAIWPGISERATALVGPPPSVAGYISAMCDDGHPVIRLCGQALKIRHQSYAHLADVQDYIKR